MWSIVAVGVLVFVGTDLSGAPTCGAKVGPVSAECQRQIDAFNDELWRTQTLARFLAIGTGYVIIVAAGVGGVVIGRARDRRRRAQRTSAER